MSKDRFIIFDESMLSEVVIKAVETAIGGYFKDVPYVSLAEQRSKYLTRDEAAKELRITPTTLSVWVRDGLIPNRGKGRKMLFKTSDIEKLK